MSKFFDMAPNYNDLYKNIISDSSSDSSSSCDSDYESEEDIFKLSKSYRKVSFYNVVHIICIPTRHEYRDFYHELWYSRQDFQRFRFNYIHNQEDHLSSTSSSNSDVCSPS